MFPRLCERLVFWYHASGLVWTGTAQGIRTLSFAAEALPQKHRLLDRRSFGQQWTARLTGEIPHTLFQLLYASWLGVDRCKSMLQSCSHIIAAQLPANHAVLAFDRFFVSRIGGATNKPSGSTQLSKRETSATTAASRAARAPLPILSLQGVLTLPSAALPPHLRLGRSWGPRRQRYNQ